MNRTCKTVIDKCVCEDTPILNISSEAADPLTFIGIGYTPFNPWSPQPLGDTELYVAEDCYGVEFSVASQEIANLLAQLNATICQQAGSGGESGIRYSNSAQTATVYCPNGAAFSYTVDGGTFVSPIMNPGDGDAWLAASNAQAMAYALQQASALRSCLEPSSEQSPTARFACLNQELDPDENSYSITGSGVGDEWEFSIVSGSLPSGIRLVKTGPGTVELQGSFTAPGIFNYTILAEASEPVRTISSEETYYVLGIANVALNEDKTMTLPGGSSCIDYSFQLLGAGGEEPISFSYNTEAWPSWLSMSASGLISGTPPQLEESLELTLEVGITDANGQHCAQETSLTISALVCTVFPTPPDAHIGDDYYYQFVADFGEGPWTFSLTGGGTVPNGIGLLSTGVLIGDGEDIDTIGEYQFGMRVIDSNGCICESLVDLEVRPVGNDAVVLVCPSNPAITVGSPAYTFEATGPYAGYSKAALNSLASIDAFNKLSAAGCNVCNAQVDLAAYDLTANVSLSGCTLRVTISGFGVPSYSPPGYVSLSTAVAFTGGPGFDGFGNWIKFIGGQTPSGSYVIRDYSTGQVLWNFIF